MGGAALASALSLTLSGLLILRTVFWNRRRPVSVSPEEGYRPDGAVIRTAMLLGLPYIGERVTINLGQILMTSMVAHVGTIALAANHIATTIEGMCYLPAYGVSFAATALVGQAVGARSREDASAYGRLAGLMGFLMCLGTGALMFLLAPWAATLFTPDGEVVALTARVLRIVALSEPFFGLSIVMSAPSGHPGCGLPHGSCPGVYVGGAATIAPLLNLWLRHGAGGGLVRPGPWT